MTYRAALTQPLSLRRDYGASEEGGTYVAESGLPEGDGGGKGLTLDKSIPGTATFSKPEKDIRDFDKTPPGSEYRRESPDEMEKPQDRPKDDDRHMEEVRPRYEDPGGRPPGDQSITKYPYRSDPRGKPNTPDRKYKHYASADFVAQAYLLKTAHEFVIPVDTEGGVKVATRLESIEEGLNPKVNERSRSCSATLKRADIPNLRWIFSVDCGNGPKAVKVKATRKGNATQLSKMDLHLSCSCPAWRWLGSEHHAKGEQYIDGKPRGTASVPIIRDPENINRVCKHVAAVLGNIRKWQVGPKRQAVKTAMAKRACETCVAVCALEPKHFDIGYKIAWQEAPGSVYVRARGKAEFAPAEFQLRRQGEVWPDAWVKSADLAGDLGVLGLDIRWAFVPEPVKSWVSGKTPVEFLRQACLNWGSR